MTTQEEKIDYIYERLKQQEIKEKRQAITKWLIRIAVIGYIYYLVMIALPSVISGMMPELPSSESFSVETLKDNVSQYFSDKK